MLRSILFIGFVAIAQINLIAQDEHFDFEADITNFMQASTGGNMDVFLDKTYPGLFKLVPRNQLSEAISSATEGIEFSITVDSIDQIYGPYQADSVETYRIDYYHTTSMQLNEEMWEVKDVMLNVFKVKEGFQSSEFDETTKSLILRSISIIIAIKEDDVDEWKYLQYQPEQKMMFNMILPSSVISEMFPE